MIGDSTYIRKFTPEQRHQMEAIAAAHNLTTVPAILFHALENYYTAQQDIARLNRIIEYKQRKIERLTENQE